MILSIVQNDQLNVNQMEILEVSKISLIKHPTYTAD